MSCTAVVLASGSSVRFGGNKLLANFNGAPLIRWAVETARRAGLETYVVVKDREVAEAAGPVDGVIYNPWWHEGLSSSVKAAVVALIDRRCILFLLGDMPCVKPETAAAVAKACSRGAAVPTYRGIRGNPVAACRDLYPAALWLTGDVGLRAVLKTAHVIEVEVNDPGIHIDVDSLEQLARGCALSPVVPTTPPFSSDL